MALKLSKYEDQARLSVYLGMLGILAVLGAVVMMYTHFEATTFYVYFNPNKSFVMLLVLGLLGGLVVSVIGFFLGLNSAGQKRNTRSRLSWQGFFLNAIVITLLLSAAIFFVFTRYAISTHAISGAAGS